MKRLAIIGWDGATWDLLEGLIASGQLPNLGALRRESVWGTLASVRPPVTAPAWVTLATGVNPGRHGCYDFNVTEDGYRKIRPLQTWDIGYRTFYEVLAERGRKTILVNLPVTHPPLTDQITVTSLLTQGENAVFPRDLPSRHRSLTGYRVFPDTARRQRGDLAGYLADIRAVEAARFRCARDLWEEPWDVFFTVFSGMDWVSHEVFPDLSDGALDRHPEALGVIRDLDEALGWILDHLGPDDGLMMVSDHGFRVSEGTFYINEWLESLGFLRPDYSRPALPASHRMEEEAQRAFLGDEAVSTGRLRRVHESAAARLWIKVRMKFGLSWPYTLIPDPSRSRAFTLTSESLGIHVPNGEESVLEDVADSVSRLRDPFRGGAVFASVERRDDVYHGPFTRNAPHLVLGPGPWGVAAAIRDLKGAPFHRHRSGIHAPEGIFLGRGAPFAADRRVEGLSLIDVAPLIYYTLGEPLPADLDGAPREDLFPPDILDAFPPSFAPIEPPRREKRDLEDDAIQDRLKGLGYMG